MVIDQAFLKSIGVNVDDATAASLSEHFQENLRERVLSSVVETLSDSQLAELNAIPENDHDTIQAWLQANVPDFSDIVSDETDILLGEIVQHSDEITS